MNARLVDRWSGACLSPDLSDVGRLVIRLDVLEIGHPSSCAHSVSVVIVLFQMFLMHCLSTLSLSLVGKRLLISGRLCEHVQFSLTRALLHARLLCCLNFTLMCLINLWPGQMTFSLVMVWC